MTFVSNDFCIVILFSCTFSLTFFITVMCRNILLLIYFSLFSEVIFIKCKIAVTILFNFKLKALQITMYKYLHLNQICGNEGDKCFIVMKIMQKGLDFACKI